ncbi:SUF system Fe-S cluster assembly regulator [Alphaproteobacteria bacterium]|nr:SUF system Fe-S cluster assembly regulator [Alphaproteobacteria bacterium]
MIKVSRMADYAVLLVCKMSKNQDKFYSANELSLNTSLKTTTINKILTKLTKANITSSIRGVTGGYKLAMGADDISVGNIIDIIDGRVALTVCVEKGENNNCELESVCTSRSNWQVINNAVCNALNSISIEEMANPFKIKNNYKYKEDKIFSNINNRMV